MATDNATMLELINNACDIIGIAGIGQLNDKSLPQSPLITKYPGVKIDMLMSFPWYFAMQRFSMTHESTLTSNVPGMPYIYTFPETWEVLNVFTVESDASEFIPRSKFTEFKMLNIRINNIDTLAMATTIPSCIASCVVNVDELMFRYNQPFKRALSLMLAMEYDVKLRQKPEMHQRLTAEFQQWMISARDVNMKDSGKEEFDPRTPRQRSKYIRVRDNG